MHKTRLSLESLSSRTLPSATLLNGVLTIEGTTGRDTITVSQSGTTLTVQGQQINVNGTLVSSVEVGNVTSISVFGRKGSDTISLTGVTVSAFLSGGKGNDVLTGGKGDDVCDGGSGNDILSGKAGNDELRGKDGDDTIKGGAGDDICYGGSGDDICYGGSGDDELRGHSGLDVLYGESGNDHHFGGFGDDSCNGGSGDDSLSGDDGNDSLTGGSGDDHLDGGSGDDHLDGGIGTDDLYDIDEGLNGTEVEGTITGINLANSTVTITTQGGQSVTLKVTATTKLERDDVHVVSLSVFQIGDAAEAEFNGQGVALELEALQD